MIVQFFVCLCISGKMCTYDKSETNIRRSSPTISWGCNSYSPTILYEYDMIGSVYLNNTYCWLVVSTPLKNMKISWG